MIPFVEFIRKNLTKEEFMNMSEQDILSLLREIRSDKPSIHVTD